MDVNLSHRLYICLLRKWSSAIAFCFLKPCYENVIILSFNQILASGSFFPDFLTKFNKFH